VVSRPNVPCTGCGKLMWPKDLAAVPLCNPCRRVRLRRPCDGCGAPITKPRHPDYTFEYCSRDCYRAAKTEPPEVRKAKQRARNAQKRARREYLLRDAEHIDHDAVFARDGFKCQICGGRLAMKQTYPHPKSPSLDHIIPLSRGGAHDLANVQAAHLVCNQRKGVGGADQLRLIG
jgi:5-methylcytosine-specific restriction endonuclease McrA